MTAPVFPDRPHTPALAVAVAVAVADEYRAPSVAIDTIRCEPGITGDTGPVLLMCRFSIVDGKIVAITVEGDSEIYIQKHERKGCEPFFSYARRMLSERDKYPNWPDPEPNAAA